MAERSQVFPAAEFRDRLDRLQHQMMLRDLELLLLTTPADIFYLTGFLTRFWESPARPWYLLVPVAAPPVAIIPSIGANLMASTWIDDIRTWEAPNPADDGLSLLVDAIAEYRSSGAGLGIPMGPETYLRMPQADLHRLSQSIDAPLIDGTDALRRTREVKSEAEISKIREICSIAGDAFARLPEQIQVGQPLEEIFRVFQTLLLQSGADWVSYLAGAVGQNGYGDVISPATKAPLRAGDVLMLDTGAVKDGYFCDFDRNIFVGERSEAVRQTDEALWTATEDVLEKIRLGHRACDIHQMLVDALEQQGARPCPGRLGHGLGITLTEWPSFAPFDTTELREGMVLTIEPSAFVKGDRFLVHEENFVLRADGAELLSPRAPRSGLEL